MIYVKVQAIKSEGRLGIAGGWRWHDTDDVVQAVGEALQEFGDFWADQGHGAIITYEITVAPDASPRRTVNGNRPLPVAAVEP